jgi:hypothetical protein
MDFGEEDIKLTEGTRLRCYGHVKRIPDNRLTRMMLEWEPEGI